MLLFVTPQDIKSLPIEEKIELMEALWEDMRCNFEASEISPEMLELLRERRERVARGEARLLDWDQVKFTVGRG